LGGTRTEIEAAMVSDRKKGKATGYAIKRKKKASYILHTI
jgi:hypothetical protein